MQEQDSQHYTHRLGADVIPVGRLQVVAPYDGRLIATVDTVDARGAEQALATAQRLFADRSAWLPTYRRKEILYSAAELLSQRAESIRADGRPRRG